MSCCDGLSEDKERLKFLLRAGDPGGAADGPAQWGAASDGALVVVGADVGL